MDFEPDHEQTQRLRREELPPAEVAKAACLIVIEGQNLGAAYSLEKGRFLLGRSPDAHVHIDNHLVSRLHAELVVREDAGRHCELADLNSTNGTFVNETRIERVLLRNGDKIRIGDQLLKYLYVDEHDLRYHTKIHELIRHDDLTALLTRSSFYKELRREISRTRRKGHELSLLMMDIDHFKAVNDTHGHLVGSAVLAQLGQLMSESLRAVDLLARYGGEEFIAFLPETTKENAIVAAERLRQRIELAEFRYRDSAIQITISIGVATLPADGTDLETLVLRADQALYKAKRLGRNLVCGAKV